VYLSTSLCTCVCTSVSEYLCVPVSECLCEYLCEYLCVYLYVYLCVSSVDGRLYMLHQLLAAVVTSNVYDEAKDVANDNKTRTWLCTVADWLLSLKSRLCRIL